jgi:hypothetical protein
MMQISKKQKRYYQSKAAMVQVGRADLLLSFTPARLEFSVQTQFQAAMQATINTLCCLKVSKGRQCVVRMLLQGTTNACGH